MTTEELILKAIDQCIEKATSEQKKIYAWMKAALQYPDIERFIAEVKAATQGIDKVSLPSLRNAIDFAASYNEFQIRSFSVSDKEKDDMIKREKIRLKEVEVRITGILSYFGWLKES